MSGSVCVLAFSQHVKDCDIFKSLHYTKGRRSHCEKRSNLWRNALDIFFGRRSALPRSTQPADGKPAVNARDRIGSGPWQNFKGTVVATSLDDLHSANNKLGVDNSLSERGLIIPYRGFAPNRHDVLTGSDMQGRAFPAGEDRTCRNWTSSTQGCSYGRPYRQDGPARRRSVEVVEFVASLARARWRLQPERFAQHRRRRAVLLLRHPVRRYLPAWAMVAGPCRTGHIYL
jgi:hypothetical protein